MYGHTWLDNVKHLGNMHSSSCNYFFASTWADIRDYERQWGNKTTHSDLVGYSRSLHTIIVGEAQLGVLFDRHISHNSFIPSIYYAICLDSI